MAWPQGKILGGSSSISYMINLHGSPYDYDNWASSGCTGWEYDKILPYFVKSERNMNKKLAKMSEFI